jgi:hypothetical protein
MPDETSPLLIDSAVSMMFQKEPDDKGAAAAADTPEASASALMSTDAPASTEHAEGNSADPAPADGNQNPPADQGDTTEGQADPGDALPPIEPPSSWSTEEKAEWNSLSRKAQEAVQRREQDNTRELRTIQNRQAEQQKLAEAEVTRLKGLASLVENVVNKEVADLAREFPEIKSEQDLVALATSDPARATLFKAKLDALNATMAARNATKTEVDKATQQEQTAHLTKAKEALLEAFPAWTNPEVARKEVTELQDYVVKAFGVDEATARGTIDPVIYKLTQKAMLYDRAQAAKAAAVDRTPPRTVKPGAQSSNPRDAGKEATRRSQLEKLNQSGDIDDALKLMFGS